MSKPEKHVVKVEVAGRYGPVPDVHASPSGIKIRIDFRDRPTHWVEVFITWRDLNGLRLAVADELRKRNEDPK